MSIRIASEKEVREKFCKKYRCYCVKRKLKLRDGLTHQFDCVSVNPSTKQIDWKVVAEISSATLASKPSRNDINDYQTTKKLRIMEDLFFLSLVKAKQKYLILTDQEIYEMFNNQLGRFAKRKRIEILPMP